MDGRVLIVDDDAQVLRVLTRVLQRAGNDVAIASNGEQAASMLVQRDFDVVLSDIAMPDMDGMRLLRLVRGCLPDVPVILMTGAPQLESAMQAVAYGAFEYLPKPIDLEKLEGSVSRAIAHGRVATEQRLLAESVARRSTPVEPVRPGAVLAEKYKLLHVVGAGGMGTVYEAVRVDLDKVRVAVKVLHPKLLARADTLVRFRREAETVATIDHPNIVKILDFSAPAAGPIFFVMEMLRGRTLAEAIVRESTFSEDRVTSIAKQILSALQAAHEAGIVHRDLKPENVFLLDGDRVKLLDFGLAMPTDVDQRLTQSGVILGTPAYLAPEIARGEKPDIRADIYTVGCTMYEALTGTAPFHAPNYNALIYAIQQRDPTPIRSIRPDVSEAIQALVFRAMSKTPADRFSSASEMIGAFRTSAA